MRERELTRREFLVTSAAAAAGVLAVSCAPPTPLVVKETVVVEKEKEVTQVIEKEKEVTKVVEKEKEVTKVVEKEKVVTPTPLPEPKEAPMLYKLVQAGELSSVDERMPVNPMVIDLPWAKVGKYGGSMRKVTANASFGDEQPFQYGHSPLHWLEGGIAAGPGLAERWDISADASEWTFYFRKGLKWSDGEPFAVDDVLFWWEDMALNDECSESVPAWALVGGAPMEVTKIDDFTVKFKFAGPNPLADFQLAGYHGFGPTKCPQPKHYLEQFHPDYSTHKDFETFYDKWNWWQNPDHPVTTAWDPIQLDVGQRLVMERNPYHWIVDKEGNQLPYIDRVDTNYVEDIEVAKLQVMNGQVDFMAKVSLPLRDLSVLKESESQGGYRVELWEDGAGGAPAWSVNWNQPDPEKTELIRKREFRLALSHAINRPRIKKLLFFGLGGPPSTGTVSPNTAQFNRSEKGKKIFQEWRDHAVEYDPEKAKRLLDEAGALDQNGDGWRQLPSGGELQMIIYNNSRDFAEAGVMLEEDWRAVGLNAVHTMVSGQQIGTDWRNGDSDVRIWGGGAPNSPDILVHPQWLVSRTNNGRWAPLYGQWMALEGTSKEGVDADKPPRERTPRWEEPPPEDPNYRMWQLFKKARVEPDMEKRDELLFQIIRIHIDDGPFLLGMISDLPRIVIVGDKLMNVPTHEEIPMGGWLAPWELNQPGGVVYSENFYFES